MMIHAPSAAFVVATMTRTIAVTMAPNPLMAALVRQPGSRILRQWIDHPELRERERHEDADHVERDQRVRVAAEHTSRTPAHVLSTTMPFEKARRSPWFMNWRGRYRSRETIDASRGKSA